MTQQGYVSDGVSDAVGNFINKIVLDELGLVASSNGLMPLVFFPFPEMFYGLHELDLVEDWHQ